MADMADGKTGKAEGSRKKRRKMSWKDDHGWKDVTPVDSMAMLVGSDQGGFLSLEEIDGEVFDGAALPEPVAVAQHGSEGARKGKKRKKSVQEETVEAPDTGTVKMKKKKKTKRRKKAAVKIALDDSAGKEGIKVDGCISNDTGLEAGQEIRVGENLGVTKRGARRGKKVRKVQQKTDEDGNSIVSAAAGDDVEPWNGKIVESDCEVLDVDMSGWAHLRLHPLLEKAIAALGFKEPTPIQNACIPAAAHQGKDVIGAAETGSGKTLAFGIPMLQRLLEEQEKNRRHGMDGDDEEGGTKKRCGGLRGLIISPTRELALQICDHLRAIAKFTNVRIVPIVGGMAAQKQERLLKQKPEIVVATPGRLWELMKEGEGYLLELHALSFFVLDEADRMVEKGHFRELQCIIDMLPRVEGSGQSEQKEAVFEGGDDVPSCDLAGEGEVGAASVKGSSVRTRPKRRQTLVFSATLALPENFKKKLKRGLHAPDHGDTSIGILSARAGLRHTAAIMDLTSKAIVANQLEESVLECTDAEKDAYLYYILKVHGRGRTIVFCTSISAVRRVSAIMRLLQLPVWPLHAQMQQRQRLKSMDKFRETDHCILIATDVAARGLDVPGIRTVIHYQLPHSAEIYVHRSGRTARAQTDGCSITLVTPSDRSKYGSLCKSLSKGTGFPSFPVDSSYMPAVEKRMSLAIKIDKASRKAAKGHEMKSWISRNAEALELDVEDSDEDDQGRHKGRSQVELKRLQQQLSDLLKQPLEPKSFSRRYVTGVGISPMVAQQLQQMVGVKRVLEVRECVSKPKGSFVVIGQETTEPLEAFRRSQLVFTKPKAERVQEKGKGRNR